MKIIPYFIAIKFCTLRLKSWYNIIMQQA